MDPRILFVVSGSYGDLAQALYFSEGQPFRSRTAVALARQLYDVNHDSLTLRTYSFSSADEIVGAAADFDASIVIILSAYGFPIEGLTTIRGIRSLVRQLRDRGCHVVTTDPFQGLASAIRTIDMYRSLPPASGWKQKLTFWKAARRLTKAINGSARRLRDVTHLYPMPTQAIANPDRQRRLSYFNPNATTGQDRRAPSGQSWLFVLSQADYDVQHRIRGRSQLVEQLVSLFRQTRAAGRRPVLIAPPTLIRALGNASPGSLDAELNPFGAYATFEARLLDAEYAFYWNLFSASAVSRLLRKLPVFFFDRGHVAHFNKRMHDIGIQSYYGGWEPKRLPDSLVEASALARFWDNQEATVDEWIAYLAQSPTPTQVIDALASDDFASSPSSSR